jgi:hypothetical protein
LKSQIWSKEYPDQYQQPEPPAEDIVVMEKNTPGMPHCIVPKNKFKENGQRNPECTDFERILLRLEPEPRKDEPNI